MGAIEIRETAFHIVQTHFHDCSSSPLGRVKPHAGRPGSGSRTFGILDVLPLVRPNTPAPAGSADPSFPSSASARVHFSAQPLWTASLGFFVSIVSMVLNSSSACFLLSSLCSHPVTRDSPEPGPQGLCLPGSLDK